MTYRLYYAPPMGELALIGQYGSLEAATADMVSRDTDTLVPYGEHEGCWNYVSQEHGHGYGIMSELHSDFHYHEEGID